MNAQATATQYLTEIKFRNAAKKVINLNNKSEWLYGTGHNLRRMYDADFVRTSTASAKHFADRSPVWFEIGNLSAKACVRLQTAGFESSLITVKTEFGKETETIIVWRKAA